MWAEINNFEQLLQLDCLRLFWARLRVFSNATFIWRFLFQNVSYIHVLLSGVLLKDSSNDPLTSF